MPWICPRCQLVHSDLSMNCNCPPPTKTVTSFTIDNMTHAPCEHCFELKERINKALELWHTPPLAKAVLEGEAL